MLVYQRVEMKIMKIPQQEWHIDGEFNEVQVLGLNDSI